MTVNTPFESLTTDQVEREHLIRLAAGMLSAVRAKAFFTPAECAAITKDLPERPGDWDEYHYDGKPVWPRVAKLGPAVYDHSTGGELGPGYWRDAEEAASTRALLLNGSDPLHVALNRMQAIWKGQVRPLTVGGRPTFGGTVRDLSSGVPLHFDGFHEFPGEADDTPVVQLTFNCYLQMPEAGGELEVFRRQWLPEDEAHRGQEYFYPDEVVAGQPRTTLLAETGDAILFDPRNYHRILPRRGSGKRLTFSFYLGLSGAGELLVWS